MPQLQEQTVTEKGYAKLTDNQMLSLQIFLKRNKIPQKKIADLSGYRVASISTTLPFKKPILEKTFSRFSRHFEHIAAKHCYCHRLMHSLEKMNGNHILGKDRQNKKPK